MVNSWYGLIDTTNPGTSASTFAQLNQKGVTSGTITLQTQSVAGTWTWNWPTTAGTANQVLTSQGGGGTAMTWQTANLFNGATIQAGVTNPTGTTSTSIVMMGLGTTCKLTPVSSTRIWIGLNFIVQNTVGADGVQVQLRFGTGTAPANGAAATGTLITSTLGANPVNVASAFQSATPFGLALSLTPGTAYWFDIGLSALSGGTASMSNVTCTAYEM